MVIVLDEQVEELKDLLLKMRCYDD